MAAPAGGSSEPPTIRLLGTLEITGPQGPVELRGAKRRALIARLALSSPHVRSLDALVGDVWGPDAPAGARSTVQTYVSQLRRVLPAPLVIVTRGGGYGLVAPPDAVDLLHFDRLVEAARTLVDEDRLRAIDDALALGGREPLAEFVGQAWADECRRAYERSRVDAQSLAIDTLLDLGRQDEALPRAERLVAAHPLAEGFWAQLVLAHYRAGNQAASLRACHELRTTLAEELGVEPGPEITELERRVLEHDPALAAPAAMQMPTRAGPELPDGTVTFFLTDIVDSTTWWDREPKAMAAALVELEQLIDEAVRDHHGQMIKSRGEGDSTFSVFARATDALDAAIAVQLRLRTDARTSPLELDLRIGLHTGQAQLRDGDYYGGTINRAARVRGVAGPGQILLSRATHDLAVDVLPDAVVLVELGPHLLKGLQRAETIFAVAHPDLLPVEVGAPSESELPSVDTIAAVAPRFVAPPDPLYGRARELDALREVTNAVFGGRGGAAVVSGEPGIGKTRLAREIAADASVRGAAVWWGAGYEGDGAPAFWPIVQMLRSHAEAVPVEVLRRQLGADAGDILRFVPELADVIPGVRITTADDDGARFRQFDALTRFVRRCAAEQPLVIVFDDLQWADPGSLSWLEFAATSLGDAPVMFFATVRDTEPGGLDHATRALGALARVPVTLRITLDGLDRAATTEHVATLQGTAPSQELVDTLVSRTAGNPFFLGEIVRFLESGDDSVPDNVKAVIGRRLDQLSPPARTLLRVGAVAGREFDLTVAAEAAGLGLDDALDAAAESADARLVDDSGRRVRFVHALVRDTLLSDLRGARRIEVHRQVAEATLRTNGDGDELLDELARLFAVTAHAGDVDQALDYSLRAAARSEAMLASETAVEHYQRALELIEIEPGTRVGQRAATLLALGRVHMKLSDQPAARTVLMQAAAIGDDAQLVEAALRFRGALARALSEDPDEVALYERAIATGPSAELAARLHARAAIAARQRPTGWAHLDDAWRLLDASMSPEGQYDVLIAVVMSADDRAPTATERIAGLAPLLPVDARADAMVLIYCSAMTAGDRALAEANVEALESLAAENGLVLFQAYTKAFRGAFALLAGAFDEAIDLATAALALSSDQVVQFQYASIAHTAIHWRGVDPGTEMQSLLEVARATDLAPDAEAAVDIGLAQLALDRGDDDRARELAAPYRSPEAIQRSGVMADHVLAGLAEISARAGDGAAARLVYDQLAASPGPPSRFVQSGNGASLGPVALYRGTAARTLGLIDESVDDFQEAIEQSRAFGARPEVALAQVELAMALAVRDAEGDAEHAEALVAEAAATSDELGLGRVTRVIESLPTR